MAILPEDLSFLAMNYGRPWKQIYHHEQDLLSQGSVHMISSCCYVVTVVIAV